MTLPEEIARRRTFAIISHPDAGKTIWSSGFLPSIYQGVQCQTHGEPILFAQNPEGVTREQRRATIANAASRDGQF